MFEKICKFIGAGSLVLFSFFYTDQAVNIVKRNDPIMKQIKAVSKNYEIEATSALVNDDEIISGVNGVSIDIDESYKKMKNANGFYETMLIFNEVIPDTTILNTYDKFVVKGNQTRSEVSLVFKIDNLNSLEKVYRTLLEKNTLATFFIDGTILENNSDLVYEIVKDGYEIENFGYNDDYTKEMFDWTNNLIFSLTNANPKFCYSEYNNYDILDLCKVNKMHTVKPYVVSVSPFNTIKNNLSSGMIYGLLPTEEVLKELPTIISYIKQKGYDLVKLEEVISENRILEK